jgi:predicted branched-subunit amino acid permease
MSAHSKGPDRGWGKPDGTLDGETAQTPGEVPGEDLTMATQTAPDHTQPRRHRQVDPVLRDGVRDGLSVVVGYVPFALALGAAVSASGVGRLAGWSSSWLLFAGASQLTAVELLDEGAGAVIVVAATLVVNARHLMYSTAMAPHLGSWPRRWRLFAPYLLADPVYVLAAARFERGEPPDAKLRYYLGAALSMWAAWQATTAAGVVLAANIPPSLPLGLAAPLTFLVLLIPTLRNRACVAAALTAGAVALAASGLPLGLGLLAGAVAGTVAGAAVGTMLVGRDG